MFGGGYVEGNVGDRRDEPWWEHETPDAEDIELARDLGRPDYVLDAMREGEWGVEGDKTNDSLAYQPSYNKKSVSTMRRAVHILEEAYGVDVTFDRIDNTPGNAINLNARTYRAWGHITSGEYKDVFFEISWNVDTNTLDTSLPQVLYRDKMYDYVDSILANICNQVNRDVQGAHPWARSVSKGPVERYGVRKSVPYDKALPNTSAKDLVNVLGAGGYVVFPADTSITESDYNDYVNRFLLSLHNEDLDMYMKFMVHDKDEMPDEEYFGVTEYEGERKWLIEGMVSVLVEERGLV